MRCRCWRGRLRRICRARNQYFFTQRDTKCLGEIFCLCPRTVIHLILLDQGRVIYADNGDVDFTVARHATLQQDSAPTQNSGTATATNTVSLWQAHAVGVRLVRTVNWQALAGAVQYVAGADYAGVGSPA